MNAAGVSVIVPVWNRCELLERLLRDLQRQTHPVAEILVIDNGSEDASVEVAEQHGAKVIRMGSNTGFSRAVNRGIRESRSEWVAIVNNDVQLAPDWLGRLLEAARQFQAWFAAGKILKSSQRDRIDGTYDAICRGGCAWRVGHDRADGPEFSNGRSIWFAPATAALYRAELFRTIGFFDETFESYLEDVDFGIRCACLNYAGRYVPEALAYHVGSATLGKWHGDTVRRIARNQALLVAKFYPRKLLLRYSWSILVAQMLWGVLAARHGSAFQFLWGKAAALRLFAVTRQRSEKRFCDAARLSAILDEGEREIRDVQRRTGFDLYWRLYFALTAGGAK